MTTALLPCPVCGGGEIEAVLDFGLVPARDAVICRTAAAARAEPLRRLCLAACRGCGMMFNAAHDGAVEDAGLDYESTQSCSDTFVRFNAALAQSLVRRHGLAGGKVVEVGCGQGEFLAALLAAGMGRAFGFDPAFDPRRSAAAGPPALSIAARRYEARHLPQGVDLVCCKMTLEHVTAPLPFLGELAQTGSAGAEPPPLFVQVPNAAHILGANAFWDIYYEHFAYYTEATLAAALARAGYGAVRAWTDFGGQYLMMEARLGRAKAPEIGRGSAGEQVEAARAFAHRAGTAADAWRLRLRQAAGEGRPALLWGGGSKAVGFLALCGFEHAVAAAVDINPRKRGTFLPGTAVPVVAPDDAAAYSRPLIVVLNPNYMAEIGAHCAALGLRGEIVAVGP